MSEGYATYTKVTSERKAAEITTMRELLTVLQEAGHRETVTVQIYDAEGRRHEIAALYHGESSGVTR